jgi:hypothetical protein
MTPNLTDQDRTDLARFLREAIEADRWSPYRHASDGSRSCWRRFDRKYVEFTVNYFHLAACDTLGSPRRRRFRRLATRRRQRPG